MIFLKISRIKSNYAQLEAKMPLSLIICAKNELDNLKTHLQSWTSQKYVDYEIIIVNDCSTDNSKEWLNNQATQIKNLRVIHLEEKNKSNLKGKRDALWKGIQAAKNDYLVFTDADCRPISYSWLQEMANSFYGKKEIVIGYSPYEKKKGLLNELIRYETFITAIQYIGFAALGKPYMGVGRNIAYKKSLFNVAAFEKSNQSISGDDDLVFQQIFTKDNVSIQIKQSAFVESKSPNTWESWFRQKTRHSKAGIHYPLGIKTMLGLYFFSNVFPLLLSPIAFADTAFAVLILGIQFLKMMTFILLSYKIPSKNKWLSFLYLDIFYWYLFSSYAILSTFAKDGWKSTKTQ